MRYYRIRLFWVLVFILMFSAQVWAQNNTLQQKFQQPEDDAKPWCFWYWMYGAVSKEGITADLEAMKEIGLEGTYLMPIKSSAEWTEYPEAADQLTPQWWDMVQFALVEANRLGLKIGMHISDGFALAGGPWITPEESMQKVICADTIIEGGKIRNLPLPRQTQINEDFYKDIAILALPLKIEDKDKAPIGITSNNAKEPQPFSHGGVFKSADPCWIQYEYASPYTCRNIEIEPSGNNYQAQRLKVQVSDDGETFRDVVQLVPARHGWQNTDENSTHAIPPTTGRFFRLCWDPAGSEPGAEDLDGAKWKPNLKIKNITLHTQPRVNQWEGKAGLVWRIANITSFKELTNQDCVKKNEIVDLTYSSSNETVSTILGKGKWKILRIGHTSTGHRNATGGGGKGLECDKFSETAVQKQFDNWFGEVFKRNSVVASRVLKYMHIDSWECGSQNWSENFLSEFEKRRGYDLSPYLPLFAGIPVESATVSEMVMRDVRTTISELVVDVFYKVLAEQAKKVRCQVSAECVSPTMVSDGMLHYKMVDRPMGEFWFRSSTHDKPNDMLDAISGAHIYGKNIIQAEGFTQLRTTWDEHPGMLKPLMDRNFALGINKMFYHVYCHNPYLDRKPGMTLDGIGLYFQRDQTWWKQGKAFVDYTARCQAMLQYGQPVVDVAVYTGEEMPRRAILPDRLVNSLPGIFGKERVESEKNRLANIGQPLREMPAGVFHSSNMADPEDWVDPLSGYAYDSFNMDALLNLCSARKGQLNLPGGASYKVLILPLSATSESLPLSIETQIKLDELRDAGVVIPDMPFTQSDFASLGIEKDFIAPKNIAWTHRTGAEGDVYFVSNQENRARDINVSLRINGKQPEIWNPVTGRIIESNTWEWREGRTVVNLMLAPYQSVFIVLRQTALRSAEIPKQKPNPGVKQLAFANWKVNFKDINVTVDRNELFDWSHDEDERIKYYSGTAIYNSTFKIADPVNANYPLYLNFQNVDNLATVRINGVDCGTIWTPPFKVDISKAARQGDNTIEIEVTNTWANAINGADKDMAPFEGIWTNAKYRMAEDKLLPAGVTGLIFLTK